MYYQETFAMIKETRARWNFWRRVRICDNGLCHESRQLRDEQTDVRVCDDDESQAKRTYGRTVTDGKRTDGYRRYCTRQKFGSGFLSKIWVTDY